MFKFLFPKAKNKNNLEFHLSTVNKFKLQDITNRFSDFDPHPGASKYLDIALWIPKFINHAQHLGLESKKSFNILDIGTCPGLFHLFFKNIGHKLKNNHLKKNGKIFLELNQEPNGLYYSQELLTFFKETGAIIKNNHVKYQF